MFHPKKAKSLFWDFNFNSWQLASIFLISYFVFILKEPTKSLRKLDIIGAVDTQGRLSGELSVNNNLLTQMEGGLYYGRVGVRENQWTLSNVGVNWIARESNRDWRGIAMSSDGKYQTAVMYGGQIYTSYADTYLPGGNLGIGTTEPIARLAVMGDVGIGRIDVDNAQGWARTLTLTGGPHAKLLVTETTAGVKTGIFSHSTWWTGGVGKIGTESSHPLALMAGYGNDVMTLTTAGNVGIGTTAPTEKLEVNGRIFTNTESGGIIVDAGGLKRVGLMKYSGREGGIWRTIDQDFEIGRVTTGTLTSPTAFTTDLYIDGSGNVGIGTTAPTTGRLVVSGGNIDVTGNRIINVGTPTEATDAVNKAYVDSLLDKKICWAECYPICEAVEEVKCRRSDETRIRLWGAGKGCKREDPDDKVILCGAKTLMFQVADNYEQIWDADGRWIMTQVQCFGGWWEDLPSSCAVCCR